MVIEAGSSLIWLRFFISLTYYNPSLYPDCVWYGISINQGISAHKVEIPMTERWLRPRMKSDWSMIANSTFPDPMEETSNIGYQESLRFECYIQEASKHFGHFNLYSTVNSRYNELQGTRRKGSLYRKFVIPRVGTIRKTLIRGFVASSLYREVRYTEGTLYRELTVLRFPSSDYSKHFRPFFPTSFLHYCEGS